MKTLSLQTRVTLGSALLLAGTLLVVGLGASLFLYEQALHNADEELSRIADRVFAELRSESGVDEVGRSGGGEIAELLPTGTPFFSRRISSLHEERSLCVNFRPIPVRLPTGRSK